MSRRSQLGQRVRTLEQRLEQLEQRLSRQVRTREVIVLDETGTERVQISAAEEQARVRVRLPTEPGHSSAIELYASGTRDGTNGEVGLCILRSGEVVTRILDG